MKIKRIPILVVIIGLALAGMLLMGANSDGGVISHRYQAGSFASTQYAGSGAASSTGVDVGLFGAVQFQTSVVVSTTGYITITPQFSNQNVACSSATAWITATEYMVYPLYTAQQVVTSTGVTTASVTTSDLTYASKTLLTKSAVYAGTNYVENREIPAEARCFRVTLGSDVPYFTPTLYLRFVNRQ